MKNQSPIGQFGNYKTVEVKTAAGGTFTNEVEDVVTAPAKTPPAAKQAVKPKATRTRSENVEFLKKLISKSDELFKLSGDEGLKIKASDIERLSDARLNEIVNDLINKPNPFLSK